MLFWVICAILAAVAAGLLIVPLWRAQEDEAEARTDIAIYKDQLAEVDRDLARGVLDPTEAERAKVEISRRLLAADKAQGTATGTASKPVTLTLTVVIMAAMVGGGLWLYNRLGAPGYPDLPRNARLAAGDEMRANRVSQAEAEAEAAKLDLPKVDAPAEYLAMVQQLRDIVPTRPEDQQGWALLARHEAALGNYAAAAEAQAKLVALQGDSAELQDIELLADLLVGAAAGFVSPEAEAVARHALDLDADSLAGRYYMGLLYAQTDRPDVAFRLWRDLTESGIDDPHVTWAREQVMDAAQLAGIEYTLPEAPGMALPGPSAADVAAASEMSAGDQGAMIQGMVQRLSDRLATEGGTPEEWARLINALGVLGDTDRAAAIWQEAQQVYAGNDAALATIAAAAASAGIGQ